MENTTLAGWSELIGAYRFVFLDEAERIADIGVQLKLVTDRMKEVRLLLTGSSALELANGINEPLTGHKWEHLLYPLAWKEWSAYTGAFEAERQLEQRLVLGRYPEVLTTPDDASELLRELAGSYLYRDLLGYKGVRKRDLLEQLLSGLALQLGSEVPLNELGQCFAWIRRRWATASTCWRRPSSFSDWHLSSGTFATRWPPPARSISWTTGSAIPSSVTWMPSHCAPTRVRCGRTSRSPSVAS